MIKDEMIGSRKKADMIYLGIDVLLKDHIELVKNKRVGLVTNHTGVNRELIPSIDLLYQALGKNLKALFGPEHGIRGTEEGGKDIDSYTDEKTGCPVYSLYGATFKPTPEMIENVDVLVFDIQDIGSRSYTYISTMHCCLEASRDYEIPLIILDRPNPITGNIVEGNILDPKFKSFIGIEPIAYCHGMTVGELARLFNESFDMGAELSVIPMQGWKREMTFEDTGLYWVPTSPHIPDSETSWYYPVTGILGELRTINEGVGYTLPFRMIASPKLDADRLADAVMAKKVPGLKARPVHYCPYYGKYKEQMIHGIQVYLDIEGGCQPVNSGYHIMECIQKTAPDAFDWEGEAAERINMFDKANGTDWVRNELRKGMSAEEMIGTWQKDLDGFKALRKDFLIY